MDGVPFPQACQPDLTLDLRGEYQQKNLRTVLAALDLLGIEPDWDALAHTAARTGLRGRWEKLQDKPLALCDIGHNPPALRENFAQLERMMASGRYDRLLIVYGIMADKALDEIIPLMPRVADYYFATPNTPRALPAEQIATLVMQVDLVRSGAGIGEPEMDPSGKAPFNPTPDLQSLSLHVCGSVADAIREAQKNASENSLIYIGGSTFVVSEAITYFETL